MNQSLSLSLALFCLPCLLFHLTACSSSLPELPSMPEPPTPKPVDSIPMEDSASAPETLLDLPIADGPYKPTWNSIEENYPGSPDWLREAKFGIWVHFGPQSAGKSGDWYARNLYKQGSRANRNHIQNYGHPSEAGYKEVLRDWNPDKLDPAALTQIYQDAGARFLIIQGVHHDNFDLWNSRYQPWNSVRLGPQRDLMNEWATAARNAGIRFGITFHHEYTWWWWQTAFNADKQGPLKGVPYDGHLTLEDGQGTWWEGLDPRMLYGIDLREYQGVAAAADTGWSPPPAGLYGRHTTYAHWYAKWWALRMMDAIEQYDPDFIYTDGTGPQPFSGDHTGTGLKADAMQRVIAHFYNRALDRRGTVDTFSIVKFRPTTNGTVNTEEFGVPREIKTDQPWIAEAPVGDWFYAPGFTYDSGMMIRYILEAVSRDGNAALCVSLRPDGSLDEGSTQMLREVGQWMRINGKGIYGSHAWVIAGEGQINNGHLRMLPGGKLGRRHADFRFSNQDFRFTIGSDGNLYAYCMTVPEPGTTLQIKSLSTNQPALKQPVSAVSMLGCDQQLNWSQDDSGLHITLPPEQTMKTAIGFRIITQTTTQP